MSIKEKFHTHIAENGTLQKCYHICKPVFSWQFWVANFGAFPVEHFIWEKIFPFSWITKVLGVH